MQKFVAALTLFAFLLPGAAWAQVPAQPIINLPYAAKGQMIRGTGSATTTTAANISNFTAIPNVKNYIVAAQCFRSDTGTSPMYVTLNDSASTVIGLPNGGAGNNPVYSIPLVTAANTQLTFTESANTSTVYCNAQGYQGQ